MGPPQALSRRRGHPIAVFFLLALAAVSGAIGIGGIWANQQLLDTGAWVSSTDQMLRSPEIRNEVSEFLAEELVGGVGGQVREAGGELGAQQEGLLTGRVPALTEAALKTPRIRKIWHQANRATHKSLLRVLNDEGGVRAEDGAVVLDLDPALRVLASQLTYGPFQAGPPPPGAGRIEVVGAGELETAQSVVKVIRHVPLVAALAVGLLYALALLGAGLARRGFAAIGLSLVTTGALALVARVIVGHQIVDALVAERSLRVVGYDAWEIATSTVVTLSAAAIGLGALVTLAAVLLGDSAPALALRRGLGPVLESPAARLGAALAIALAFVVLVVWAPIAALGEPLGILLFALVIGTGAVLLGRLVTAERSFTPRY